MRRNEHPPRADRRTRLAAFLESALLATLVALPGVLFATPVHAADVEPSERSKGEAADAPLESGVVERVEVPSTPIVDGTEVDVHANPVTLVSSEQIEALGARDLTAALRHVPGVVISRWNHVGAFGGGWGGSLYIRGHGSGRPGGEVGTLVDGIPRFVGVWTHPLIDTLPIDGLGRVEVHKSAQAVRFGPIAGYAAVNMVPEARSEGGHDGRVRASLGELSTSEALAELSGREGRLDYALSLSRRESEGHRTGAGGRVAAAQALVGWRLGETARASLLVQHTDGWAEDPGRDFAPSEVVSRFDTQDTFALFKLEGAGERYSWELKAYRDEGEIDWFDSDAPGIDSLTDWTNEGVRAGARFAPWQGGELSVGLDIDSYGGLFRNAIDGVEQAGRELELENRAIHATLAHAFRLGEWSLTPSLGARVNDNSVFGGDEGLQAGLALERGGTTLYANWTDAYNLPGVWSAVVFPSGWRDLEPEEFSHAELGLVTSLREGWELSLSVFSDEVEGAIRIIPPPLAPPPPVWANVGRHEIEGAEVSLRGVFGARLSAYAGASWLDAEASIDERPDIGVEVPYAPEWVWSVGVRWLALEGLALDLDVQHQDERFVDASARNPFFGEVDAFTVANARVTLEGSTLGLPGTRFFAQGENLLEEDYEYRPGYPMPGRTFLVGVEVELW